MFDSLVNDGFRCDSSQTAGVCAFTSFIINSWPIVYDGTNSIVDGSDDMFDGGNMLSTNFQSLAYTDGELSTSGWGKGGRYFTVENPLFFITVARLGKVCKHSVLITRGIRTE